MVVEMLIGIAIMPNVLLTLFYHPSEITKIIISGNIDPENYYRLFSINTGYPATDLLYDPKTLAVSRFAFPILFVTQNYISTTIIVSMFAFIGQWKCSHY